jgi:hypothetical protein
VGRYVGIEAVLTANYLYSSRTRVFSLVSHAIGSIDMEWMTVILEQDDS